MEDFNYRPPFSLIYRGRCPVQSLLSSSSPSKLTSSSPLEGGGNQIGSKLAFVEEFELARSEGRRDGTTEESDGEGRSRWIERNVVD